MRQQQGFTLLELLVVLTILSVLAYFGSAQLLVVNSTMADRRVLQDSLKILSDALLQSRQLAIVSGQKSLLCGGIACSGHWSEGYEIYQHNLHSKAVKQTMFTSNVSIRWRGFPAKKNFIEFKSNGLSAYQNGRFELCVGEWQADIVVNQSGRFYLSDILPANDCIMAGAP